MLALALVHVELDGVAIGAVEGFVTIEDHLEVVIAWRNVVEVADRIAEGGVVDRDALARLELLDIDAEDHLRFRREADLQARLGAGIVREQ